MNISLKLLKTKQTHIKLRCMHWLKTKIISSIQLSETRIMNFYIDQYDKENSYFHDISISSVFVVLSLFLIRLFRSLRTEIEIDEITDFDEYIVRNKQTEQSVKTIHINVRWNMNSRSLSVSLKWFILNEFSKIYLRDDFFKLSLSFLLYLIWN